MSEFLFHICFKFLYLTLSFCIFVIVVYFSNSFSKEQFCNCLWIDHSAIRLLGYMKIFTQPPCSDHQVHECSEYMFIILLYEFFFVDFIAHNDLHAIFAYFFTIIDVIFMV